MPPLLLLPTASSTSSSSAFLLRAGTAAATSCSSCLETFYSRGISNLHRSSLSTFNNHLWTIRGGGGGGGGGGAALGASTTAESGGVGEDRAPSAAAAAVRDLNLTPGNVLASLWGSCGVAYILIKAIKRVLPIALEPFSKAAGVVPMTQFQLS